ncbi:hypothetical protein [Clavibacter michiganensis]|uniref:hypothetical protein n=1 Tax=Clavibacter michiganensis TaxID=28447 RepID=UPI00278BA808|nr:hypothetical protein [Clavibacter michiganensis]MDQ0411127.1 hypothetical protein [Clavibacter michiganensis]
MTSRSTRSPSGSWWYAAPVLVLGGSLAHLLDGTPAQVWSDPLGNALVVAGATSVWTGEPVSPRPGDAVVARGGPGDDHRGRVRRGFPCRRGLVRGQLYVAPKAGLIAMSTRVIVMLDAEPSRARWRLMSASGHWRSGRSCSSAPVRAATPS